MSAAALDVGPPNHDFGFLKWGVDVFQYLESLDSVSAFWPYANQGAEARDSARHLQIFLEVLMTLILGGDVVVPQPYAFDSWGFLNVASRMLGVRSNSGPTDHPFRLHLHKARSFDDAIRQMLGRVGEADYPFISSLLPELNRLELEKEELPRDLNELLACHWLGDERAEALNRVHAELSTIPCVHAQPRLNAAELPQLLTKFAESSSISDKAAASLPDEWHEVHSDLIEAIRLLDPYQPKAFTQRSGLRISKPWPNDTRGRIPEVVVGDSKKLDLVIEFVDTLYNAVLADSIGVAPAIFTTDVGAGRQQMMRAIAQEITIDRYFTEVQPSPGPPPIEDAGSNVDGTEPLFEVWTNADSRLGDQGTRTQIENLVSDSLLDGVGAVMEQRAARGTGSGARSPFWTGLDKLNSAIEHRNGPEARQAFDEHLKLVVRLLGRGTEVEHAPGWKLRLTLGGLTGLKAAGTVEAGDLLHLSTTMGAGLAGVSAVAVPLAGSAVAVARKRKRKKQLFIALGRTLSMRDLT